ncbi:MAG: FAD-dependent oxidoreductase, partial [Clostridiaceae bacterium]|nr:FAD-dependent oxidoreductase [Clostridiaceae bacterium]
MSGSKKTYDTDTVVFGAGTAVIAAAIAAAKEGQETYLIEINNQIGGVMAASPGMMLGAGYPMKTSIGGFFKDYVQRMYNHTPPLARRRLSTLENLGEEVVYDPDYAIFL